MQRIKSTDQVKTTELADQVKTYVLARAKGANVTGTVNPNYSQYLDESRTANISELIKNMHAQDPQNVPRLFQSVGDHFLENTRAKIETLNGELRNILNSPKVADKMNQFNDPEQLKDPKITEQRIKDIFAEFIPEFQKIANEMKSQIENDPELSKVSPEIKETLIKAFTFCMVKVLHSTTMGNRPEMRTLANTTVLTLLSRMANTYKEPGFADSRDDMFDLVKQDPSAFNSLQKLGVMPLPGQSPAPAARKAPIDQSAPAALSERTSPAADKGKYATMGRSADKRRLTRTPSVRFAKTDEVIPDSSSDKEAVKGTEMTAKTEVAAKKASIFSKLATLFGKKKEKEENEKPAIEQRPTPGNKGTTNT